MSFTELLNIGRIKVKYNGDVLDEYIDYAVYVNVQNEIVFELDRQNITMNIYDDKRSGGLLTVYRFNSAVCICPFKTNPEGVMIDITETAGKLYINVIN